MFNYMRSELYRIFHRPGIYVTAALLCFAAIGINCLLAFFPWEQYGEGIRGNIALTGVSYSSLLSTASLFIFMGAIIPGVLYTSARRYGDLKNTLAFGMSRVQIYAAKCLVGVLLATLLLALTYGVWILCAELLLAPGGPCSVTDVLFQVFALYLIACANVLTIVLFFELFNREVYTIIAWLAVWCIVPSMLSMLGLHFDQIATLANWTPYVFLQTSATPSTVASSTLAAAGGHITLTINQSLGFIWTSAEGLQKYLASGACGTSLFSLAGWLTLRRRDL